MKAKILIADDENMVRTIIQRALQHETYHLLSADNGDRALDMAKKEKPDLILLDIGMPGKSGHQVLHELRSDVETQMIPVILLTGNAGILDKVQGLSMGADDYVTKPFDLLELRARISSVLRRYVQEISANPLTKLPGSPSVEEELNRRLRDNTPFAFFHIDIDNFKAYNDAYGYATGDKVLLMAARTILDTLKTAGGFGDFVGHIGGDDFVVITHPERAERLAALLGTQFDSICPSFYKLEDRAKGYILTVNRQGQPQRFPLMTLSVSVATNEIRAIHHYAKLVEIVTEIKKRLKMREDRTRSAYMIDRRGNPWVTETA